MCRSFTTMGKDELQPFSGSSLIPASNEIEVMLKTNGDTPRIVSYGKPIDLDKSDLQSCPKRPHSPLEYKQCGGNPNKSLKLNHFNGDAASHDNAILATEVPAIQWLDASVSDLSQEELPADVSLTNPAVTCTLGEGSSAQHGYEHEATRNTEKSCVGTSELHLIDNPTDTVASSTLESSYHDVSGGLRIGSSKEHPTAKDDAVADKTTCQFSCRIPFNGHKEDFHHYEHCPLVLLAFILRKKHAYWLSDIPSNPGIMKAVDAVFGPCKQVLLNGKCRKENCSSNHEIDLDSIPSNYFVKIFNIVNKWFLHNAVDPDMRAMLTMLAKLREDSDDTLNTVISYANMIWKLSNQKYKEALAVKLIEILVNVMGLTPWEAVRTLLVSIVTPETEPSEILNLLGILAVTTFPVLKNHLYESLSVLWHINLSFAFPQPVLLTLLDECLVHMPLDLKLTKDRMLLDLVKLPRSILLKKFPSIEKFLGKYYPSNSTVAHVFRTSVLYSVDVSYVETNRCETSRVKGTGPVNPHWDSWHIHEERLNSFNRVIKNGVEKKEKTKSLKPLRESVNEKLECDVWEIDLFKLLSSRNVLCYDRGLASNGFTVEELNDLDSLVEALNDRQFREVVRIMQACSNSTKPHLFNKCLQVLQLELERYKKDHMALAVHDILAHMHGSASMKVVKGCFVQMVNAFVVKFHEEADYATAMKFIAAAKLAGVNSLDYPPEGYNLQTFAIVSSDVQYQCRLYKAAIETLTYKDCLHYDDGMHCVDRSIPEHIEQAESLILSMLKTFLKEGLANFALKVFWLVLSIQKSIYFPLRIAKYYEGVIFWSFITDSNKNTCSPGDGASLYVRVDGISSSNHVCFSSITYRSLLVELTRANSPEGIIRRVLLICLAKGIYPDFTDYPVSPLVFCSHLAEEEMSIYLRHLFACYAANDVYCQRLADHPLVVTFSEVDPPTSKVFPIPNDIMKTPTNVPAAMERLRSVLTKFCNGLHQTFNAEFSEDRVTIPVEGVKKLLEIFKPGKVSKEK